MSSSTPATQIDSYRIEALLGEGGMAQVYRVWHTGLQRHEALKTLLPHLAHDRQFVERFLHEARTAAGLHHPNIATIHTVSAPQSAQPYFTMQLVEGGDLCQLLQDGRRLSLSAALPLLTQIAEALDYAHGRGVIHRDVKPANILLERAGDAEMRVKLVDFGIARAQQEGSGTRLTKAGMIVGTPEYMSPEQAEGRADIDYRTDLYSLGIVAYEMLCGQPPFRASAQNSAMSLLISHMRDLPRPPVELLPGLEARVSEAILRVLAKEPNDRYTSCREFVSDLTTAKANPSLVLSANITAHQDTGSGSRPHHSGQLSSNGSRAPLGALMLTGLVGVTLMAASFFRAKEARPQPYSNTPIAVTQPARSLNPVAVSPLVSVPDLLNQEEQEARKSIEQAALTMQVATDHSAAISRGHILSQKPVKNTMVEQGAVVHVVVSTGPSTETTTNTEASTINAQTSQGHFAKNALAERDGQMETAEEDQRTRLAVATADVTSSITAWKNDWQRLDFDAYIAHYAPQARVYSNNKPHDYQSYYIDEKRKFAGGGRITISISELRVTVSGEIATAKFSNDFRRVGGASGSWHSFGMEMQTWHRVSPGRWLIYEDTTTK